MPGLEEVLIPGEIENRSLAKGSVEGILVGEACWRALLDTPKRVGVDSEEEH